MDPDDPDDYVDPLRDTVLAARFRLKEKLGDPWNGLVYRAEDLQLGRPCAVRFLVSWPGDDPRARETIDREARAFTTIKHDNMVDIYHLGEGPDNSMFLAMELLSGEDLLSRRYAREARTYSWRDCCEWILAVARALAAVHHAGLLYLELKPSRVFLTSPHGVKLLSRPIRWLQDPERQLGNPYYMAPEQAMSGPLDARTDVYSLGVLLFELVTGELPFPGGPVQAAIGHCYTPPPSPRQVGRGHPIPPALAAVVLRALAKDPAQRHPTMAALAQAIARALA